jgi:ubiquinone/menaquinone biosynthesis C-methylase UbiE
MTKTQTFDQIWEEKYHQGHSQRYPWDLVVSFIFRHFPREKARENVKVLEIGCGTGSNLWFAAREGFQVTGIDGSPSAIAYAKDRFLKENLDGHFLVGDFTQLPFEDETFDLVIDRGSLTCCSLSAGRQAVHQVHRVLQPGGKFLSNPYSDRHSSYRAGKSAEDGLTVEISAGSLQNVGQICFYGKRDVESLFSHGWNLLSLQHLELTEQTDPQVLIHAEWRAVAQKEF